MNPILHFHVSIMMDNKPKISIKRSLQKEKHIGVDSVSPTQPSFSFETTLPPIITTSDATYLHPPPPPPLQPSFRFLSFTQPDSTSSSPRLSRALSKMKLEVKSLAESPRKVRNLTHKLEGKSMPLSGGEVGLTCAFTQGCQTQECSRMSSLHGRFSIPQKVIKDVPNNGRCKEKEFKCSALCMYPPVFGKTKPVKERNEETKLHSAIPLTSRPVSVESFEPKPRVTQARNQENIVDESISSCFDLPSELFKCSSHRAQSVVTAASVVKNGSGIIRISGGKSNAPSRHVHFST